MFAGNFAPAGWLFCDGQLLPIGENETLYTLFGTTYGGDGINSFALPDLRGRIPIHAGQGPGLTRRALAAQGGQERVTLTPPQIPSHGHALRASTTAGSSTAPAGLAPAMLANGSNTYGQSGSGPITFNADFGQNALAPAGHSADHPNVMPYLCINFIVSLFGIYPTPH